MLKDVLFRGLPAALLCTGVLATAARAAVTISIDDVVVPAGTTARVGVYASSDSADVISGFNLPTDVNNDGFVDSDLDLIAELPEGFTYNASVLQNSVYADIGYDTPLAQLLLINVDGIATGSGDDIQLSAARTKLFELVIDVAGTVQPGTVVPIQIIAPPAPFEPLFNVAGPNDPVVAIPTPGVPALGSITVSGIPEPTLMCMVLPALALLRRRRGGVA